MKTEGINKALPYLPIPAIVLLFIALKLGTLSAVALLNFSLLLAFGYLVAWEDMKTKTVPNFLILIMLAAWGVVVVPQLFADIQDALGMLTEAVLGCATGGGLFLAVYLINKKSLGGGDLKFMAVSGLYLGFASVLPTMLLGSIFASLYGIVMLLLKKMKKDDEMPLTPFLYLGMLVTVFLL